jgi:transcriptional regulator with XRE-family HTH domain
MSVVLDPSPSTTPGVAHDRRRGTILATGLLYSHLIGTNAGLGHLGDLKTEVFRVTGGRVARLKAPPVAVATEVASTRDHLVRLGLTRQQISRALGVDRRSLSGWATGEIRPTAERLEALRTLLSVASTIDRDQPGRVSEILLHRRGQSDLLDQLARGRADLLQDWARWAAEPAATAQVRHRTETLPQEPVWAAAARAWADGRLSPWERQPTVRPETTYEADLTGAEAFMEEPANRPSREGYA